MRPTYLTDVPGVNDEINLIDHVSNHINRGDGVSHTHIAVHDDVDSLLALWRARRKRVHVREPITHRPNTVSICCRRCEAGQRAHMHMHAQLPRRLVRVVVRETGRRVEKCLAGITPLRDLWCV